ncbi:helix-turn-helix transcriptional regulator [Xanthomonas arboricola]|uniref:helix-turn-helix transcriptional regulator n=1 Tax=Xanthomonas arboricola TaxID=56448 RepID=UPI002805E444|nr:AlpA family transcriptional regulator [Xanthomonas arboricola]
MPDAPGRRIMPRLARRRSASSAEVILRRPSSLAPNFFFASPCVRQQTHAPPCAANSLLSFAGCIAAPARQRLARIVYAGRQRLPVVRLIPAASNRVCKKSFYTAIRVNSDASASSLLASPKHMAVVDRQVKAPPQTMLASRTTLAASPGTPATAPRPDAGRSERFLRKPEVLSRTGISRSHLYWLMDRCRFPKSIPLSPRVTVWLESDVDAWIAAQIPATHPRAQS